MHDEMCEGFVWMRWLPAMLAIALAGGGVAAAQAPASDAIWTFSTDSANNLVIQDLEAFTTSTGRVGAPLCLQFRPACPSSSDRRSSDLRLAKPRYLLPGSGARGAEWRVEPGQPTVRDTGTILPFLVGGVEQGMVQIVSSPGPWAVDLQRIPAVELRAGDGKRWNVYLRWSQAPPEPATAACWLEVACPSG